MDQCTENFECLVINNNSKSNKIEEQVFWYKADEHEKFQLGHPSFWNFNSNHYEERAENDDFRPDQIKKKKGPLINVKKNGSYY